MSALNFDFSDDQKLLADQVKRFLDERCDSAAVRRVLDGEARWDAELWKGLAELGLTGTAIPLAHGGTGAGYLELCLVAQQLGAHLAPVPFAPTVYLATEALLLWGSQTQQQRWLPRIAAGDATAALAAVEQLQRLDPGDIETRFDTGTITGDKLIVTGGGIADLLVVLARGEDGPALYLVEADASGVTRSDLDTVDPTRNAARIGFDHAPAELLTVDGTAALTRLYDRAAVLLAFEQLGGAQRALDMAVAYAKERFAFGRPIGSFQAIKHMLADMYVAMKLAENNCYYAAWALANDTPDLPLAAATARVGATRAFQLCTRDNTQVHGGMGFTWEFDCHLYYRRSNALALELGSPGEWEARLVDNLHLAETAAA